jgi:HEAT repeat protein
MKIKVCASILVPVMAAACGNGRGAAEPPRGSATEFHQLRGPDLGRARELYRADRREEGAAILRELAADPDWNVRSHAIRVIGEVGDRTLLPSVHAALNDDRLEVRESASRVLIGLGDASSVEPLRKALSDREGVVRSHAADALIRIAGVAQLEALGQIVSSDPDPAVRAGTVRAMAALRDPAVAAILISALEDESAIVRGEAADAVAANGSPSGRAALERVSRSDPDSGVRERAAAALQRLGAQ